MDTILAREKLDTIRWSDVTISPYKNDREAGGWIHLYQMICSECRRVTTEEVDVGVPTEEHPPLVLGAMRCQDCGRWSAVPFNRDVIDILDSRAAGCANVVEGPPGPPSE